MNVINENNEEKIILYSTGCPKCNILKEKLNNANIDHEETSDTDIMLSKGIDEVPVLEIDEKLYQFKDAVDWVNKNGG